MDPLAAVPIAIVVLFALVAAKVPIAFALMGAGFLGVLLLQGADVASNTLARIPFDAPSSYVLVIVPMFIAMGIFASRGSVAQDAFAFAARLLRRVPGGLAFATVLGCAGFAAVSGSSVATVVTLGPVATKEMRAHGYDPKVAAGVVGAAGTLGVLIPPSIVLVLYGILTQESIGLLLLAGIVPGVVSAVAYGVALMLRARVQPARMGGQRRGTESAGRGSPQGMPDQALGLRSSLPVLSIAKLIVLFSIVVGGIYTGVFSTTEAASAGAAVALVLYLAELRGAPRGSRIRDLAGALAETTRLSSMAFALLIGSAVFTYFLVVAGVPASFTAWVVDLELPGLLVVATLLLAFVPLGMFLDPLSTLLIAVPLAYPVVSALGYDGLWFGILVVKMIEIGLITPPLGVNAYVVAGVVRDISVEDVFRGILWFLPVDVVTVIIIFFIPALVTWLPSMSGV